MLKRSTVREIKSSFTRYLAILAIVALGVGFFVGLRLCRDAMISTADEYLKDSNIYDYEIITSYGIDKDSVKTALNSKGVKDAEASMQHDIIVNYQEGNKQVESVLRAISIPERINKISLLSGRMPAKANECVVDDYYMGGNNHQLGDVIELSNNNAENDLDAFKYKKYNIVGTIKSPLYLDYERGSTKLGSGTLDTYFYIPVGGFDADYYTNLYINLDGDENAYSDALEEKYENYREQMKSLAEEINFNRRETARMDAQKKLDNSISKYNSSLEKYNSERLAATRSISDARKKISSGWNTVNKSEKELKTTISSLKNDKKEISNGLSKARSNKDQLQQAYSSGMISEEDYNSQLSQIETNIDDLNFKLSQVDAGISEANTTLNSLKNKKKELKSNTKTINNKEKTAKTSFQQAKAELDRSKAKLDDAQEEIDEMEQGSSFALDRSNNSSYSSFEENSNIIYNISKIFPLFFLLVALLVCMTTMTRMIEDQRSQIGILLALGFNKMTVRGKYLFYAGSSTIFGSILGLLVGSRVFPMAIWKAYTMIYNFSESVNYIFSWKLGLISVAVALMCSLCATWGCCSNVFRVVPSTLIKPKSPPGGKRILLERATIIWGKMNFGLKTSLRNVFRYKKRLILMILGVGGCTALVVAGLGVRTTISGIADRQYSEVINYDYQIAFNNKMTNEKQQSFIKAEGDKSIEQIAFVHQGSAKVEIGGSERNTILIASDGDKIIKFINFKYDGNEINLPGMGEVIMCRKAHDQYGLSVGDVVEVKDGFRKAELKISGFYDNYIEETMFMSEQTYKKAFGKPAEVKTAYIIAPKDLNIDEIRQSSTDIAQNDEVSYTKLNQDMIDTVDDAMDSLMMVVYIMILCAGGLSFVVLFNLSNINIIEREREIATIKVLGYDKKSTANFIIRENNIITVLAIVVGLPLGKILLKLIIDNMKLNSLFYLPKITFTDYIISILITILFTVIVSISLQPKINGISMADALKTLE